MGDNEAIKNILLDLGLYSLGLAYVGSESELLMLFKTDFESLVALCQQ